MSLPHLTLSHVIARNHSWPVKVLQRLPSTGTSIRNAMTTSTRQQPYWQAPPPPESTTELPPLKIWNSLTRTKTPFVPLDWRNKRVGWYVCGPTVYDDAHLGHARSYVTTDIIRRILRDYFKYKISFVMNITDVDDKIIIRGRQQYLLADFISKHSTDRSAAHETSRPALEAYLTKNLPLIPPTTSPAELSNVADEKYEPVLSGKALDGGVPGDREAKIKMHLKTVKMAAVAMIGLKATTLSLEDFYNEAQDIFLPYLDLLHGSSIDAADHSIFTRLTQKFETRFMEDIRALNCLDPDVVTRVTEYGQQIVEFVEGIQKNGFAYATSDGSVYFDIDAFEAANNPYARLEPWNRNDRHLLADGEGVLTKKSSEKKSEADFALWKSSKPGEPSWSSPWGPGRPGWHIECSAMASEVLGSQIDIHSGGIDLAFPHHDNELAQSEAFWSGEGRKCERQWVNYFMHMGHLSIQGSKMSKSLKNFTTIREALSRGDWTPRGLRIVFLLGSWKDGIEITDDVVKAGAAWEEKVNNFFIKANDMLESTNGTGDGAYDVTATQAMEAALETAKSETFDALCDSFSTSTVMASISELITVFNSSDRLSVDINTIRKVATWVTSMVNTFGLNGSASSEATAIGWSGLSIPDAAKPYVYQLSEIRDRLRQKARSPEGLSVEDVQAAKGFGDGEMIASHKASNPYAAIASAFAGDVAATADSPTLSKDILQLCDRLRDVDLWCHGIYLEDRDGDQPALVRPVTRELLATRQEKDAREAQKQRARAERLHEAAARASRGQQSPVDMYRTAEYSEWDEDGMPTKDAEGKVVAKNQTKRLRKGWETQKKLHEAWVESRS